MIKYRDLFIGLVGTIIYARTSTTTITSRRRTLESYTTVYALILESRKLSAISINQEFFELSVRRKYYVALRSRADKKYPLLIIAIDKLIDRIKEEMSIGVLVEDEEIIEIHIGDEVIYPQELGEVDDSRCCRETKR